MVFGIDPVSLIYLRAKASTDTRFTSYPHPSLRREAATASGDSVDYFSD